MAADIIARTHIMLWSETLEAIHYHAYPPLWGVVGPLLMIVDVVLCEEPRSFVSGTLSVRLKASWQGVAGRT